MSTIISLHNNSFAQTYDTITKQREITKNNPQLQLGRGVGLSVSRIAQASPSELVLHLVGWLVGIKLAVDPFTNKIYVANSASNTVSIIDSDSGNVTNIPVGTFPSAIAVDPSTDKIYVANSASNTVSVISASSDKEISRIPVGTGPVSLISSFNNLEAKGKIYVANFNNNTVSVINASSDKEITRIPVGTGPSHIAVDPFKNEIYVANLGSNTVSVISASSDKEITRIPVGTGPSDIAVNLVKGKIYVANLGSNTVSVISASSDKEITRIPVGENPSHIAVDPFTDKIYVANLGSNTVSVISASSDKEVSRIPVGTLPSDIAVNLSTNEIYVANLGSSTVSVISASSDKEITRIPVGEDPSAIEASIVYPSISYVLDIPVEHTESISVIDDSVDKVATGITFNVHPANSGNVWCNNKEYPTNIYLYVASGTKCIARPANDFEFSSWIQNLPHNSTIPLNQSAISDSPWNSFLSTLGMKPNDTSATFDANRFGTFTANFKAVPPAVPPQYWIPLYGIMISTIVGWSIPSIIGWIRARTKRKATVKEYADIINSLSSATDLNSLDRIKNQVIHAHISEKISDFHYKILDEKILQVLQ